MDPSSWLDLLVLRAPALQAAGIRSVSVDGHSATIDPPIVAPAAAVLTKQTERRERVPLDPLEDPATYGGAAVPGYDLPAREDGGDQ